MLLFDDFLLLLKSDKFPIEDFNESILISVELLIFGSKAQTKKNLLFLFNILIMIVNIKVYKVYKVYKSI